MFDSYFAFPPSSFVFRLSSFVSEGRDSSSNRHAGIDAQDLLSYAQSQQRRGNLQEAMAIYTQLAGETDMSFGENPSRTTAAIPENIRRQAQRAANAIIGQGGFTAARAEFLADSFMEQVFDPAALGAMVGAGLTYRVTRFGLLGSAARLGLHSRIIRPAASLLAFGAEASLFPVYGRLGNMAMGRQADWSSDPLIHDIQGSFLVLGGLKLFGAMGTGSLRWWQQGGRAGGGLAQQILPTLVPQTAMYLGIVTGHQGEQWFGLRAATSSEQLLSESLATLIHFNALGRLIPIMGGPRVRQLEQQLEQEANRFSGPGSGGNHWLDELQTGIQQLTQNHEMAWAGIREEGFGIRRPKVRSPRSLVRGSSLVMMENNGEGGNGPPSGPQDTRIFVPPKFSADIQSLFDRSHGEDSVAFHELQIRAKNDSEAIQALFLLWKGNHPRAERALQNFSHVDNLLQELPPSKPTWRALRYLSEAKNASAFWRLVGLSQNFDEGIWHLEDLARQGYQWGVRGLEAVAGDNPQALRSLVGLAKSGVRGALLSLRDLSEINEEALNHLEALAFYHEFPEALRVMTYLARDRDEVAQSLYHRAMMGNEKAIISLGVAAQDSRGLSSLQFLKNLIDRFEGHLEQWDTQGHRLHQWGEGEFPDGLGVQTMRYLISAYRALGLAAGNNPQALQVLERLTFRNPHPDNVLALLDTASSNPRAIYSLFRIRKKMGPALWEDVQRALSQMSLSQFQDQARSNPLLLYPLKSLGHLGNSEAIQMIIDWVPENSEAFAIFEGFLGRAQTATLNALVEADVSHLVQAREENPSARRALDHLALLGNQGARDALGLDRSGGGGPLNSLTTLLLMTGFSTAVHGVFAAGAEAMVGAPHHLSEGVPWLAATLLSAGILGMARMGRGRNLTSDNSTEELGFLTVPHPHGRGARPVAPHLVSNIKITFAQGCFWIIDTGHPENSREMPVRVNGEFLRPGGSLPIRDGQRVQIGEESLIFLEPPRPDRHWVSLNRTYFPQGPQEAGHSFEFLLEDFIPGPVEEFPLTRGLTNEIYMSVKNFSETAPREAQMQLNLREGEAQAAFQLGMSPEGWTLGRRDWGGVSDFAKNIFVEWLAIQSIARAKPVRVLDLQPNEFEHWRYLIHPNYSRLELMRLESGQPAEVLVRASTDAMNPIIPSSGGSTRWDLHAHTEQTHLPRSWGYAFQGEAAEAFHRWSERRLGFRFPTREEIDDGAQLPYFNRMGLEHNMDSILGAIISPKVRFVEIGYGQHTETLEAVELRGGKAEGLELDRVYPPGTDRARIQSGEVDVLHINGSPFLFYAHHQATLPAALNILRNFARTNWVVIQAYNPRTPFEILRHAELINDLEFDVLYYRAEPSEDRDPVFPTDHGQRPNTFNSVLIARRAQVSRSPAERYHPAVSLPRQFPGTEHNYELVLEDLGRIYRPTGTERPWVGKGERVTFGRREGRELQFQIHKAHILPFEDHWAPRGTARYGVELMEGDRRGNAIFHIGEDFISGGWLRTSEMSPGVGSIFLDWLSAQARLHGKRRDFIQIQNPRIYDIIDRHSLILPETATIEAYHPSNEFEEFELGGVGSYQDAAAFREAHPFASFFMVRGQPHPGLVPEDLLQRLARWTGN